MHRVEDRPYRKRPEVNPRGWTLGRLGLIIVMLCLSLMSGVSAGEPDNEPKSIRKTCGTCPEGYATTAVTTAPELCKDGEPTLVQCVPLGGNMLAVCGQCPDGYREIGRSNVVTRCGQQDGGLLAQCQREQMESTLPDPTQGGVLCPPNCGSAGTAGEGAGAPPPKFRPAPGTQ
jgi:hypothetical protein